MGWEALWRVAAVLLALAVAAPTGTGIASVGSDAHVREFRGRVVTVDRAHMTFRVQSARGIVRFRVNRATRYANGRWAEMHVGWHVDVHSRRTHGIWVASRVERWHGAWSHHEWGDDGWHDSWSGGPMHGGS